MAEEFSKVLRHIEGKKSMKILFVIYANIESLLE